MFDESVDRMENRCNGSFNSLLKDLENQLNTLNARVLGIQDDDPQMELKLQSFKLSPDQQRDLSLV
jgi:hypothetical protein